jgi:hypothetical protein
MQSLTVKSTSKRRTRRPEMPSLPPSEREYVFPTHNDVLRGRGGRTNAHPGNQRLLELVRPLERTYAALKRGQKGQLSLDIVKRIHDKGGRFLGREVSSHGTERHYIIDQQGAVSLVEQKFRDEPTKRKSRINRRLKTARVKRRKRNVDTKLDDVESWYATAEASGQTIPSTETAQSDPDAFPELTPIHCISPAHSLEDSQLEQLSDEELELEDFDLDEHDISDFTSDPYAWGNKFHPGLVSDPGEFLTADQLIDMFLDGNDPFDVTT